MKDAGIQRLSDSVNPDDLDEIEGLFFEGDVETGWQSAAARQLRIVALISPKGGTGKTSIAINLAGVLTTRRRATAVIDLDPRANADAWAKAGDGVSFPVHRFDPNRGAAAFRRALRKLVSRIDVLVIDTPPGMGPATDLALQVADLVLIPTGPSALDISAAREAVEAAHQARHGRAGDLPWLMIVPARLVSRTRLARNFNAEVKNLDVPVAPIIAQRVEIAAAGNAGRLVRPGSAAAVEFENLGRQVWSRLRRVPE